jgi:hypothetical protein
MAEVSAAPPPRLALRPTVVAGPGLGGVSYLLYLVLLCCCFSSPCWPAVVARSKKGGAAMLAAAVFPEGSS